MSAERSTPPTAPIVLGGARLVLPDRVIEEGWIALADGRIAEIGEGTAPERALACGGDTLIPGLVELHTDHLESHYAPRPKVRWNPLAAAMAYDAQIAAAGITTVFDSLRVGSDSEAALEPRDLWTLAGAIDTARREDVLRVEHRTHLRCEVTTDEVVDQTEEFLGRYPVHLISLMDHTPGQRQFTSIATWKTYYGGKYSRTESQLDAFVGRRLEAQARNGDRHRRLLVEIARRHGIVLASHDDAGHDHVDESIRDGVRIAEFPTTVAAAERSGGAGIAVMMGAPNIVRGGSHSGNIAAADLAEAGLLDILSSDYVPASLLMAGFDLPNRAPGLTLPAAIRTVTLNPARATGLTDRGALEVGLRADVVRVGFLQGAPFAREVYRAGSRVA